MNVRNERLLTFVELIVKNPDEAQEIAKRKHDDNSVQIYVINNHAPNTWADSIDPHIIASAVYRTKPISVSEQLESEKERVISELSEFLNINPNPDLRIHRAKQIVELINSITIGEEG